MIDNQYRDARSVYI